MQWQGEKNSEWEMHGSQKFQGTPDRTLEVLGSQLGCIKERITKSKEGGKKEDRIERGTIY